MASLDMEQLTTVTFLDLLIFVRINDVLI